MLGLISILLVTLLAAARSDGATEYPLFQQCDPRWGNDEMGTPGPGERATICREGCAMSCVAMALSGLSQNVGLNPGVLNTWLIANSGYTCAGGDCNNLVLDAPEKFLPVMTLIGETPPPVYNTISGDLTSGAVVYLAHVRNRTHFVLLRSASSDGVSFEVNDPYYNQSVYLYSDIADVIVYRINRYPLFKQCDSRWGSNAMGANNQTVCQVGCLMSSISMALNGVGFTTYNPGTLNTFLRSHNGYTPNSALYETVIPEIDPQRISWDPTSGMHTSNDIPLSTILTWISQAPNPRIVIANVDQGHHFVLVVGVRADGDTLEVNDPGFQRSTYSYKNDVVGWRIFDMS